MENIPPIENSEKIEKAKVLEMLKVNGFDHSETKELMLKWLGQREEEVTKDPDTDYAGFILNLERSELYAAAGMIDDAFDVLDDTLMQAENQVNEEDKEKMKKQVKEKWALLVEQRKASK